MLEGSKCVFWFSFYIFFASSMFETLELTFLTSANMADLVNKICFLFLFLYFHLIVCSVAFS